LEKFKSTDDPTVWISRFKGLVHLQKQEENVEAVTIMPRMLVPDVELDYMP